jgi:hypothetical protein
MRARPFLVAALVVAAAAPVGAWSLATADTPDPAPALPELPSIADHVDGLYDADGCLVTGPGETDCSVRAEEVDEALSHGPTTETRQLQGFVGTRWLGQVTGIGPEVLPATVLVRPTDTFEAQGLARNHGTSTLATIEVTAVLVAADGSVLDEVTATSPVHDVRPGEPVPFVVTSPVATQDVDHVDWSAAGGDEGDDAARALAWTPYWERPVGGEPVDLYLHDDTAGDRPYLLFGAVADVGDSSVDRPEVIVAWLDGAGRLVTTLTGPVVGPRGAALDELAPGGSGDALLTAPSDPPDGGETLVWVQGS